MLTSCNRLTSHTSAQHRSSHKERKNVLTPSKTNSCCKHRSNAHTLVCQCNYRHKSFLMLCANHTTVHTLPEGSPLKHCHSLSTLVIRSAITPTPSCTYALPTFALQFHFRNDATRTFLLFASSEICHHTTKQVHCVQENLHRWSVETAFKR